MHRAVHGRCPVRPRPTARPPHGSGTGRGAGRSRHVMDQLKVGLPDDGDERHLGIVGPGALPKADHIQLLRRHGRNTGTPALQRRPQPPSATAAKGLKSTSSSGGRRRWPKVHSQRPATSACRCPSRQAIVVTGVGSGRRWRCRAATDPAPTAWGSWPGRGGGSTRRQAPAPTGTPGRVAARRPLLAPAAPPWQGLAGEASPSRRAWAIWRATSNWSSSTPRRSVRGSIRGPVRWSSMSAPLRSQRPPTAGITRLRRRPEASATRRVLAVGAWSVGRQLVR